jgi:hypothetical protein
MLFTLQMWKFTMQYKASVGELYFRIATTKMVPFLNDIFGIVGFPNNTIIID